MWIMNGDSDNGRYGIPATGRDAPELPAKAWINQPPTAIQTDQELHKTAA
ncbi:hypothetical protein GCM10027456_66540 [Kineosporia babensis]